MTNHLQLCLSAKLHYTDTGYGHVVYNTTNGQAHNDSTTCCTTNLPHRNACRAQHLDMSRCWDVANFCQLVVLYSMSVAGVRVVEFGAKRRNTRRLPRDRVPEWSLLSSALQTHKQTDMCHKYPPTVSSDQQKKLPRSIFHHVQSLLGRGGRPANKH